MREIDPKHSCHSTSLSGTPGKTKRNCSRVVVKIAIPPRIVRHRDHDALHAFALDQLSCWCDGKSVDQPRVYMKRKDGRLVFSED